MLSNFLVSVKAVLPIYVLLLIGGAVKKFRLLDDDELKHLNRMMFVVFFPPLMFENLYGAELHEAVDKKLLLFGVCAVLAVYGFAVLTACRLTKEPKQRGAVIQVIYRSNFVILGLPLAANIYGEDNLAMTAVMVSVIVPLYNVLAVITLEIFRGGRPNAWQVIKKVLTNPIIIGAAAGMLAIVTGIELPGPVEDLISQMSDATTPILLIILGASIDLKSLNHNKKLMFTGVFMRLILVPGVCMTIAALLGFRGLQFVTLLVMFASPTAISAFTMAQSMDSDSELTGNCVVLSTTLAMFTLFLWIFLFKSLGMF